jgi:hypothetical protein
MKQSPSSVDKLQSVFNLSDGEKNFLLSCDKGQGLSLQVLTMLVSK